MNSNVDAYLEKLKNFRDEIEALRAIVLECGLTEVYKWRAPCYTFNNTNILILGTFKEYCVLSFFKGALLKDENNLLVKPGENSQSTMMFKFTEVSEITKLKATIKAYIYEAIEVEKAGLKVVLKKHSDIEFVEELMTMLDENAALNSAFNALTPGRQRAYNLFFSGAKQSKTRVSRIEKYIPRILDGKGINDCVCGLSRRMPNCDGSHKHAKKPVPLD